MYQKLARNNETSGRIHKNYLETLKTLQAWDEAEKFLEKGDQSQTRERHVQN
jgi:hypothetical protein